MMTASPRASAPSSGPWFPNASHGVGTGENVFVSCCICAMTTRIAARALGLADRGVIAAGKRADLAVWDVETPAELVYRIGLNPCFGVIQGGSWRQETA